jgi:hypothetical protein
MGDKSTHSDTDSKALIELLAKERNSFVKEATRLIYRFHGGHVLTCQMTAIKIFESMLGLLEDKSSWAKEE